MIKRVKKLETYLDNCRLLEGTASHEDVFRNIKKSRKVDSKDKVKVEGKTGRKSTDMFANKYKDLINITDNGDKVKVVRDEMNAKICENDAKILDMINEDTIKEAMNRLKKEKKLNVF